MHEIFRKIARGTSAVVGTGTAFIFAVAFVLIWAVSGPVFHFSNTWQLFVNTGTTIATFLMVFLLQNSQNRDSKAVHLKLDELLRAISEARDEFIDIEDDQDGRLAQYDSEFRLLRKIKSPADPESDHELPHRPKEG